MASIQMSIVRSCRDLWRNCRKPLLSTLPLTRCRWFRRLLLGMFLEFLRFFVCESERAIAEPHERLTWIRHLGRSASDRRIRFTVFVGVRHALIIKIDINDRCHKLGGKSSAYHFPPCTFLATITWGRNRGRCICRGAGV